MPSAAGATAVRAPDRRDDPPLVVASKVLSGQAGQDARDRPEATLALRDLFLARPTLGDVGGRFAGGLLARPTAGAGDPFADGYTAPATRRCSAHFCLHWVRRGADAPATPAWPAATLRVLEQVWRHHVDTLGYRAPDTDGRRGGNAKFDVYLKDVGSRGLYGYCAPERRVAGQPQQASGFCVLDDDFARAQFGRAPMQTLRVTAAHEFFHAVQFAYDFTEDPWLLESTATWMEERFADGVDDNRAYLQFGQLARPQVPLDLFETGGYAHYGNWTFWEFLGRRYGIDVVREVWRRAGTGGGLPDDYSTQALARVLAPRGGLPRAYAAYAAGNLDPARTYPEGSVYPLPPVVPRRLSATARRTTVTTRLDHLTSRAVRLSPRGSLPRGQRLALALDAPDRSRGSAAYLVLTRADGSVQQRQIRLNRRGFGKTRVRFDRSTTSVTVVLANASTRYRCDRGTTLACEGTPLDQRRRFVFRASLLR
ncbi:MXAN_6640 family putative metalloprotease [Nocardioides sp.]|uniref:MXAN_6640 family putative metalloprotease n=1 Tax=Nocardioides sp. TaxID=35761 RepID=UPI002724ED99|nr:MXAN_6640 family putative metalloprotease [Nocardioides sp.]MDO9456886.1 DUF6055 domain-containing protein [Nocardioides sp.]